MPVCCVGRLGNSRRQYQHALNLCPAAVPSLSAQGSPYSVVAILDTMRALRAPVSTVAFGMVGGTAAAVLAGGAKGRRYAMPNARILLQQPMGGLQGSAGERGLGGWEKLVVVCV